MEYNARFNKLNYNNETEKESEKANRENQFREMCKHLKSEGIGDFYENHRSICFRVKKGSRKKFNICCGGVWIEGKKLTFQKGIAHIDLDTSFISLVNIDDYIHLWINY